MHPASISYLIPPPDYLWRWAADGSAVEWEDESTICLWMELHALLHHLAPQGLPPLGSILLVLAAASRQHTHVLTSVQHFAARASGGDQPSSSARSLIRRAGNVLESTAALPEDLRSGLAARAHLLTTLFEGISNRQTPEASAEIMLQIDTWGLGQLMTRSPRLTGTARLLRDLKALTAVHEKHNLSSLAGHLRTGLDFVRINPAPVPVPFPAPDESTLPLLRQLELRNHRELTAVAALARRMVAMFALPRPAGFPQELPIGGISDITNRGPLDRLLPSELAADDTLLMARLAHNEALYFRRDSPPDEPASERIILMDSGLPLWGLPRLYLLAAALGLQAAAGKEAVRIQRREGSAFVHLPLETVDQVQASLLALLPHPDPAEALQSLELNPCPGCRPDVFFLTGSGLRTEAREALHALTGRITAAGGRCYVLTVSRSGAMELSARSAAGSRVVARGRIDPDEILRDPTAPSGAPPPRGHLTNLPALLRKLDFHRQYPLPFRFPSSRHPGSSEFPFAHWFINVDTQCRLMRWDANTHLSPGEIASGLPEAENYHIACHGEEWVVLCSGRPPGDWASVVCIGMEQPTRREVELRFSRPFPAWLKCQNGAAILGYSDMAEARCLVGGHRLQALSLPKNTAAASVVFDGKSLGLAVPGGETAAVPPPRMGDTPDMQALMALGWCGVGNAVEQSYPWLTPCLAAPVSAGFAGAGTLVIRDQAGLWKLDMPEFVFSPCQTEPLSAVRPFRRVGRETGEESATGPHFFVAHWTGDCRLIFDSRGPLHLLFADSLGRQEVTLLAILGKPVAGWVAPGPQPQTGNPDWLLTPPAQDLRPPSTMVPLLQRFASLAREATVREDFTPDLFHPGIIF